MLEQRSYKKVGIVVLNWNNHAATQRCLESLREIDYPNYVIYLLDNGSTDDSMDRLVNDFHSDSHVAFIYNGANLGFAAGCNPGISRAVEEHCDYVLLLNNDCITYYKSFLKCAVEFAERHPQCGIQGGRILFWPATDRIWSTGGYITFWGGEVHIGHGQLDSETYRTVGERSFISGALMFIDVNVIKRIGLLPDVYFFGKEEWEYSIRAIRAGYNLYYNPEFTVYHEASSSHDWVDPMYVYNGTLSKIIFKQRNLTPVSYWIWWAAFGLYLYLAFPLRYSLSRGSYVRGVAPRTIRRSMIAAYRDSRFTDKITRGTLDRFRDWIAAQE